MTDDLLSAVRARFDGRAGEYDESAMHRGLAAAVAAFALAGAGVHDVLDVGTGTGLVLRALHDERPALRLTGIDLSHGMLEVARGALPGAVFVEADATVLPFADASFDLVTCATSLHLFPDARAAMSEWARVLRPGGRAVTATFGDVDPSQHGGPGAAVAPGHASHGAAAAAYPTHHELFRTPELLAEAAALAGLDVARHEWWTHGDDRILLAELRPSAR
ncbi:methyltransferase domain-containing protein [Leifsonia shinshuensis]|uniref:class I SAM-dependent methyltransferase n=1 Tax=Leifsonia shinshuensis TaxID=150026 RepID=UPI0024155E44|nr:methyltransferase domain-containing protein [Leifsonia shinshuensis]MCI0157942.1 methyltransferase domain-containing protein [Leifsonia shinshuensis]